MQLKNNLIQFSQGVYFNTEYQFYKHSSILVRRSQRQKYSNPLNYSYIRNYKWKDNLLYRCDKCDIFSVKRYCYRCKIGLKESYDFDPQVNSESKISLYQKLKNDQLYFCENFKRFYLKKYCNNCKNKLMDVQDFSSHSNSTIREDTYNNNSSRGVAA